MHTDSTEHATCILVVAVDAALLCSLSGRSGRSVGRVCVCNIMSWRACMRACTIGATAHQPNIAQGHIMQMTHSICDAAGHVRRHTRQLFTTKAEYRSAGWLAGGAVRASVRAFVRACVCSHTHAHVKSIFCARITGFSGEQRDMRGYARTQSHMAHTRAHPY